MNQKLKNSYYKISNQTRFLKLYQGNYNKSDMFKEIVKIKRHKSSEFS